MGKAAPELDIRATQSHFRICVHMPANIDDSKDQIAEFIRDLFLVARSQRFPQLCYFFFDLLENGFWR